MKGGRGTLHKFRYMWWRMTKKQGSKSGHDGTGLGEFVCRKTDGKTLWK